MRHLIPIILFSYLAFAPSLDALNVSDYRFHSIPETSYYGGIHSIVKDKIGRIWFSGSDAVFMYDGISFTRLNERLVADNPDAWWTFLQVTRADDGDIYVGTNHGLMRYDYDSGGFVRVLDGKISYVTSDADGQLWLIRDDMVESYSVSGSSRKYPFDESMEVNPSDLTLSCSAGSVFATTNGCLYELDKENGGYRMLVKVDKGQSTIKDVERYDNTVFVLTSRDGIFVYNAGWELSARYRLPREYEKSSVAKELYLTEQGILWAATQSGLFMVDSRTSKTQLLRSNIHYPYSLPNNSVWTIYPDPDGGVWIGTYGGKLAYMPVSDNGGNWFKPTPGGLSHPIVSCFAEDANGNIWIGTEGGGVNYWDRVNDRYIHYTQENNSGIRSNMIKKLRYDGNSRLYVSSFNGGMQQFDPMTNTFVCANEDAELPPYAIVYDFEKEGNSGYWISDPDSPLKFWDTKSGKMDIRPVKSEDRYINARIEAMFRNDSGRLCLVTSKGFFELDKDCNVISHKYIDDAPFAKNDLSCYCHSSDSSIWFGTRGGGVNVLSKDGTYMSLSNLSGNSIDGKTIFGILEDETTGDIWFSTDDGLYFYDKSENAVLRSTIDNHNLCGAYYVRSCFKTRKGEMLFGGTDGFIIFDPSKIGSNTHLAKPFFVSLTINNEPVNASDEESPLHKDISAMSNHEEDGNIVLTHRQTNFEIFFSSDSYQDADRNKYAYRMKGLSDNWHILPSGQRSVAFYDILPGRYVFELKAANGDGLWSDNRISISFNVKPSPFLSIWAYLAYLTITAITATIFILTAKRRRKLEVELDHKDAEISELYSKKYVAGPSEIVVTSLEDELFRKALVFVEKNIDNNEYSVDDFVSDMAMGRTALYQKIHAITGLSIKEFILDIRLKRAAKLLAESDKTISEISYMTGFVNPKYFSTCFRKYYGLTPSEYRKSMS